MAIASPSIYTISPDRGFAEVLAQELLARAEGKPEALARMRLLLPSRRAIRAMTDAFLKISQGRPMLLPQMQAVGDVDEEELQLTSGLALDIPPAISGSRRLLLLATLIWRFQQREYGPDIRFEQAVRLAGQLAEFMDEVQREERDLSTLSSLVTGELAAHWEITVDFLQIIIREWPKVLEAEGRIDSVTRRNLLLAALAAQWKATPPDYPIIAAGTTGSAPATGRLLAVIASLPQGMVVLPGLDSTMADADWRALDETHPQWGMAQLLERIGCPRDAVEELGAAPEAASPRVALLQGALRPAKRTDGWRESTLPWQGALEGCVRVDCATVQQEATAVALLLRDALDTPTKTAALVTPNRELARRVGAILRRFHVEIDDSAGVPLSRTPGAVFLQAALDVVTEGVSPVSLLALLKHPFAHLGLPAGEGHRLARQVEIHALRGVRRSGGFESIVASIKENPSVIEKENLIIFVERIANLLSPLTALREGSESPILRLMPVHLAVVEALSTRADGSIALWEGEAGETLRGFFQDLVASVAHLPEVSLASYAATLSALMQGKAWRPRFGLHPRLHILSPMECRLQRFDRVVLAGLNEGSWPADVGQDPWMSRPMRRDFGLQQPEQLIGLAAHDFYTLAAAGEVFLTRAEKEGGAATVPSRWLLRMEALLGATGGAEAKRAWVREGEKWRQWAAELDVAAAVTPCEPPRPAPPLVARPRTLFVTHIETLLRNPYAVYARQILGLKALEPLDKEPGGAEFGNLVHAALEEYVKAGESGEEALLARGREALQPLMDRPGVAAIWWPRFERIARWIGEYEAQTRHEVASVAAETELQMGWVAPAGAVTLKARADRVETLKGDAQRVVDYKTGTVAKKDIERGLSCQLLLTGAMILEAGKRIDDLQYWKLKGGREESMSESLADIAAKAGKPLDEWVVEVLGKIKRLLEEYDDASMPYLHCPVAEEAPSYNDYAHLARPQEWGGPV